jgi:hypothetical protein
MGMSRPVMGLLYLYISTDIFITLWLLPEGNVLNVNEVFPACATFLADFDTVQVLGSKCEMCCC